MIKELYRQNKKVPLVWRSQNCKKTKSILTRSFFENIKIDIRNYILLIWEFSFGTSITKISEKLGIDRRSVQKIFSFLSSKISSFLLSQSAQKLDGNSKVVEIDETYYGQNFCVIDETSKKITLRLVNNLII